MFRPETDWLGKWARYTPGRLALREHARGIDWSYAEADARASALAAWLRDERGIASGDRVAVYSRNRAEMFFLFFAAVKLGAVLAPLNFRLTPVELDVLLRDCEPALFLHEEELAGQASRLASLGAVPGVGLIDELDRFLVGRPPPAAAPAPPADFEDPVMILYTSGTTGRPKGALVNHRMLFWNAVNTSLRLDLHSRDHTQSYAPLFHTGGWNVLFTPFLHCGASHTILAGFDAELVLELMQRERTTLLFGVPTMLQMMADAPAFAGADLSSLRYAIVGGAPMPLDLIRAWHDKGVAIRQGYGLTEVGPNCFSLHQDDAERKRGSIGQPNFYVDARIIGDDGADCADDAVGELWLRSPVATPGYWRLPEATAAAFEGDWFRTGDMVRRDPEGYFFVVDRKKNMFISGGENVYPAEVERVLGEHPGVREAAVLGVPDEKWGEVGLACVVAEPESAPDADGLRAHCDGRLARYKIPKQFRFLAALPRNEAGKIDRSRLEAICVSQEEDES